MLFTAIRQSVLFLLDVAELQLLFPHMFDGKAGLGDELLWTDSCLGCSMTHLIQADPADGCMTMVWVRGQGTQRETTGPEIWDNQSVCDRNPERK